ncbi:TetR/AcrR family transcriptional regulator C-terminal domain-containing protein [Paenibacillus sp. HWE-109]|uniref:TetR/AcrR family transcriptional regulator C-terminal domain-containing protein n=1 Tax=Paenibacillus sp. HWE-109 TaxID=1306526 RepID=UPI001EDE53E9|nr:TetR/AcrR family transcriptional regulator C-terminal domain-containing protein [Paenibacillus sp. HWE-109]UKS29152.1 TetR/AcrR family transcriptional regulator C-terminal domain-containing protein [Paenibacillus sp. HWE-109]
MARRKVHSLENRDALQAEGEAYIPLDRNRITDKALEILNEVGLKELSMRRIADALGVKAASLYYHVKDKDELLQLLGDRISERLVWSSDRKDWREQLTSWALTFREALHAYRDAVDIFNATIATTFGRLRHIEKLYEVLAVAGFGDHQIPWLAGMLKNYITSFVAEEVRHHYMAKMKEGRTEELGAAYRTVFQKLPPEQFPQMIRLAAYTTSGEEEQEFAYGLQVLLDGFAANLPNSH